MACRSSSSSSSSSRTTAMIIRHLVARGVAQSTAPPTIAARTSPSLLQHRRRCYSTHTPDTSEQEPQTFAEKWQREWAAGVGLDTPGLPDTPDAPAVASPPSPSPSSSSAAASLAAQYAAHKQQQQRLSNLGAAVQPHYQPHALLTNPPSPADVTLELLLASEAHQGHATSLWNPANARYIHGIRQGIHIISLDVTAAHLRRAAKVVQEVSRRGGLVLFVGTRDGQDRAVSRAAELAKGYHLFERWIPGSITNGQQILGRCKTKVVNELDKQIPGFDDQLYDRPVLRPDLVVCLNPLENYVLLHECALNNIPTIGVIDTNADPTWVTYPIPANDDSLRCIQVIAGVLGRAGEAGQKQRLAAAANGEITYRPAEGLIAPESDEAEAQADVKPDAAVNAAQTPQPVSEAEVDADADFSRHLDEVRDGDAHRQKGGRSIKLSD